MIRIDNTGMRPVANISRVFLIWKTAKQSYRVIYQNNDKELDYKEQLLKNSKINTCKPKIIHGGNAECIHKLTDANKAPAICSGDKPPSSEKK